MQHEGTMRWMFRATMSITRRRSSRFSARRRKNGEPSLRCPVRLLDAAEAAIEESAQHDAPQDRSVQRGIGSLSKHAEWSDQSPETVDSLAGGVPGVTGAAGASGSASNSNHMRGMGINSISSRSIVHAARFAGTSTTPFPGSPIHRYQLPDSSWSTSRSGEGRRNECG